MRILALESSLRTGSLATLQIENNRPVVLQELSMPADQRSAQSLLPVMKETLAASEWAPKDVNLVCVTTGPGSFTGLRIGVTAAKILAYATSAKLVGVHTLATLAAGVPSPVGRLWAILDAQRQELFATCVDGTLELQPDTKIVSIDDWLLQLQPGDRVVGPPTEKLAPRLPAEVFAVQQKYCIPQAAVVGRLGWKAHLRGETIEPMQLTPQYFRKSAAEENFGR